MKLHNRLIILIMSAMIICSYAYAECAYLNEHGDHDWTYSEIKVTCETDGGSFRDCCVCGLHETISTASSFGHSWVEGSTTADCINQGETYRDCSVCGAHEIIGSIDATGHSWEEGVTSADCTNTGAGYRKCSKCGTQEQLSAEEALGHDWVEYIVQAKCETAGEVYHICSRCNSRETLSITDALDHEWVEYRTDPACEQSGEIYRQCSRCGAHETTETLEALSHLWTDREVFGEETCENDGAMRMTCSNCGETKTFTIPATGHEYGQWEITVYATCTADGEKKGECFNCGKTIEEFIPRTEHAYGEWETTAEATENSMGKRCHVCIDCGASAEEWYYPEGTLYRGMYKNDAVVVMQEKLINLCILNDKADGIFGKKTEHAVIDFQTQHELEPTGIAYPETLNAIDEALAAAEIEGHGDNANEPAPTNERGFCMHIFGEESCINVDYCEIHKAIAEKTAALYNNENASLEEYEEIKSLWQTELTDLYASWKAAVAESLKPYIAAAEAECVEHLKVQEELWNNCYDDPIMAMRCSISFIMNQCANVCETSAQTN